MNPTPAPFSIPTQDELLGLLQGDVEQVRTSPLYGAGLFLVALVMVLLPLIYVALIGIVGFLTYTHAVENLGILSGSGTRFRLFAYVTPLVAGIIVCFFMVKPLFTRQAASPKTISLVEEDDPLLFAWVDRVRNLVGAPMPSRIDVNCEVNASASFRRGLRSMFGRDLVLTIGLPLAAGLSLRQFTGVLAHEFGHFTQGGGMGLSYIIRSISFWFARVVYERDEFDQALTEMLESSSLWLMIIGGISRACVWISRRILWVLMQTGHVVSCFLLRQMEYDADRYEARVAGSDAVAGTFARMHEISIAEDIGLNELGALWNEKKLPDDLPSYFIGRLGTIEDESLQGYMTDAMASKTNWLSTHPSDSDRIKSAENENSPGLLHANLEANILFSNFEDLSRRASTSHYNFLLGERFDQRYLNPTTELLEAQNKEASRVLGVRRFFQGLETNRKAFFPTFDRPGTGEGLAAITSELQKLRHTLCDSDTENCRDFIDRRLLLALQLLEYPEVEKVMADQGNAKQQVLDLLAVMKCLQDSHMANPELIALLDEVIFRANELSKNPTSETAQKNLDNELSKTRDRYLSIRAGLSDVTYPFSHMDGEMTCAEYLVPHDIDIDEPEALLGCVQQLLARQSPLYNKTFARLIEIAERAEEAIGLLPLAIPLDNHESNDEGDEESMAASAG